MAYSYDGWAIHLLCEAKKKSALRAVVIEDENQAQSAFGAAPQGIERGVDTLPPENNHQDQNDTARESELVEQSTTRSVERDVTTPKCTQVTPSAVGRQQPIKLHDINTGGET